MVVLHKTAACAFALLASNHNCGRDLVGRFIESRGGTAAHPDKRWQEFETLLSSPRLPSGVR